MKRKPSSPLIEQPARATRRLRVDQSESFPEGRYASSDGRSENGTLRDRSAHQHQAVAPPMLQHVNHPYLTQVTDQQAARNALADGFRRMFPVESHLWGSIQANARPNLALHGSLGATHAQQQQASFGYPSQAVVAKQEIPLLVEPQWSFVLNAPLTPLDNLLLNLLATNTSTLFLGGQWANNMYTQQATMAGPSPLNQLLLRDMMQFGLTPSQPWAPQERLQENVLEQGVLLPNAAFNRSFHPQAAIGPSDQLMWAGMGTNAVPRQQVSSIAMPSVRARDHSRSSSFVPIGASLTNMATASHGQSQTEECNELEDSNEENAKSHHEVEEDYNSDCDNESFTSWDFAINHLEDTVNEHVGDPQLYYRKLKHMLKSKTEDLFISWGGLGCITDEPGKFISLFSRFVIKNVEIDVRGLDSYPQRVGKLVKVLSNIRETKKLRFSGLREYPAWDAAASVVQQTRRIAVLELVLTTIDGFDEEPPEFHGDPLEFDGRHFAAALNHHPSFEVVKLGGFAPNEIHDVAVAFVTMPQLRMMEITGSWEGLRPETMRRILRVPSLHCMSFGHCAISQPVLQVASDELAGGSRVSKLSFTHCSFSESCGVALAALLGHNTNLSQVQVKGPRGFGSNPVVSFLSGLKVSLPRNNTLTELFVSSHSKLEIPEQCLVAALDGLRGNRSLQSLMLPQCSWTNETSDALCEYLKMNTSLRSLVLQGDYLSDGDWRRMIPFLRDNSTLESLEVCAASRLTEAVIPDTVEALQENTGLRHFDFAGQCFGNLSRVCSRIDFIGSLTKNTSLKYLALGEKGSRALIDYHNHDVGFKETFYIYHAADAADLLAAIRSNYGLEEVNVAYALHPTEATNLSSERRLIECFFRLNKSGRGYLVEDPTSKSKGVRVLSKVKDDLDCLFLHLQENPSLCA